VGSVTDGDVRRAMLRGMSLDADVSSLIAAREVGPGTITAPVGTTDSDLLKLMNEQGVRQIPLLTADHKIADVAFLSDLIKEYDVPLRAMIMAGGFGTRLRPLTDNTPKPMLPLGGRPLLQRTIEQLKANGVSTFNVSTHYRGDIITDYFKDGADFGVNIEYLQEDTPLGTAGALRLMEKWTDPLLIINGDILTQVNFRAMAEFHRMHKSWLTVGVRKHEVQVPYGVVDCDGVNIKGIREKPKLNFFVNAGIYLLEPAVRDLIPTDRRFDMTDLMARLVENNLPVVSFPIAEYWLDVGSPNDYEQAKEDILSGRLPA
jgi:NDP-sugar pyrophosphorylase family protein